MKISVVIPVFNAAGTIRTALASVFNQTMNDFEVIVVNDGSTDSTEAVIVSHFSDKIESNKLILIRQENKGVSAARNCGIKNAKGDYIAFLDADDKWLPVKLERMAPYLNDNYSFFAHKWGLSKSEIDHNSNSETSKLFFYNVLLRNPVVTPSIIMKNTQSFFFNESIKFAEDHELWLRMLNEKKGFYLKEKLVILGRLPLTKGGLSGNKLKMRIGEIRMYFIVASYRKLVIILLPFLILHSCFKHLMKIFR